MKRSSLFLFELIFIAVSFLMCATICIRILAYSYSMSIESRDLAQAVSMAQTAAARFQSGGNATELSNENYEITITETENGKIKYGVITIFKDETEIYSLEVATLPEVME